MRIDPYSLGAATPAARMGAINEIIKGIYLPLAQLAQQQGVSLDLNAYLKIAAELIDEPRIAEILTIQQPTPPEGQEGGGAPGGMPAETTRNYVRQSKSTQTRQGSDRNLVTTLLGGNPGGNPNGQPQPMNGMMK